jgi:ABC-type multidrug transport system ATPase subunit
MGYEGRVIREKVDFVLKLVRMKQAKEWYLDEMSCGERRRIALAMALIADPSILLLDEPLSDLDQVGVRDTVATLKELKNRGLCIIVSAHRLEDILELTDRIAVLGEGRLLMIDEPETVLSNDEILKLATVTLPAIPKLFMRLQAEGVLASNKLPLSLDQAVDRIREAVALKVEATQGMQGMRAMSDNDRHDASETLVLKTETVKAIVAEADAQAGKTLNAGTSASESEAASEAAETVAKAEAEKSGPGSSESLASRLSI